MTDTEILTAYNDTVRAMKRAIAEHENIVVEVPPGSPQVKYSSLATSGSPAARCCAA